MRQALLGVSIFIGLQLVYAIMLFVLTIWELRHLDRPIPVPTAGTTKARR